MKVYRTNHQESAHLRGAWSAGLPLSAILSVQQQAGGCNNSGGAPTDTAAGSDASNKASPVEGERPNWISLAGSVDKCKPETGFVLPHDVFYIAPAADVFSNALLA